MPKRKKYPKLPNGYGSIKYLGKGRRNAYAVHPPTKEFALNGSPVTPKALCYVDSWIKGFSVLTAYRAGTYYQGMELELNLTDDTDNLEELSRKILADYNVYRPIKQMQEEKRKTFKEIYEEFFEWKFHEGNKLSEASQYAFRASYKHFASLQDNDIQEITYDIIQNAIDSFTRSHASIEHDVNFIKQLFKFCMMKEYITSNPAQYIIIKKEDDDEHGKPFSSQELSILWSHKDDPIIEFLLIMCYSGYRIKAYENMEINIDEKYFKGGVKTKTSKNRIVPIHSAILPLVIRRLQRDREMLHSAARYRLELHEKLEQLKLEKHTPHDCRHTFSMLCEKAGMPENDRKRMLGHSFGNDVTNGVYGHRDVEDLRKSIEMIKV